MLYDKILKTVSFCDFWCVSAKGAMSNGASSYLRKLGIFIARSTDLADRYGVTDRWSWTNADGM